jgi:aminoglycoside phosphotransferase (APT) family kinase protein
MTTVKVSAPRGRDHCDPAWLTDALRGSFPGVAVSSARIVSEESGTTDHVRVGLDYSSGSGPATVFIKKQGSASHRFMNVVTGMLSNEARFYLEIDDDLPIEMPVAYATGIDRRRMNSVLLLQDLVASDARTNACTTPLTVEQCASGLEGLAGLHAWYWPGNGHDRELEWLPRSMGGAAWWATVRGGAARGVPMAKKEGLDLRGPAGDAAQTTKLWKDHCTRAATAPVRTVVHGDAHVGNTYLLPNGVIGFVDWQIVARGAWFFDVPYFIVGALTVQDRRDEERDLLAHYLDVLGKHGVVAPSFDAVWEDYRPASMYGLAMWLCTLGFGGYQLPEICLTYIERYGTAYADHNEGTTGSAPVRMRSGVGENGDDKA